MHANGNWGLVGWDNFLRVFPATRQRDCVQPRVPRTRHVAVSGANHDESAATSADGVWTDCRLRINR